MTGTYSCIVDEHIDSKLFTVLKFARPIMYAGSAAILPQ